MLPHYEECWPVALYLNSNLDRKKPEIFVDITHLFSVTDCMKNLNLTQVFPTFQVHLLSFQMFEQFLLTIICSTQVLVKMVWSFNMK